MKTKRIIQILAITALIMLSLGAVAKKSTAVISENRDLPAFSGIKLLSSADVFISQGDAQLVSVTADEDIMPFLETRVENGLLIIKVKKNKIYNVSKLEVYITMPVLERIENNGSGDVFVKETFNTDRLYLRIHGSGNLNGQFDAQGLELEVYGSGDVEISGIKQDLRLDLRGSGDVEVDDLLVETSTLSLTGSGDVELSGSCVSFTLKQTGSGDFNGYGLKAVSADLSLMGSGDAVLTVAETLRARLHGSGDLTYRGNPTNVQVDAKGSGEVFKK